jgi:dimethylargininase
MMPKRAIVREPGDKYTKCISSHPQRHTIDIELARKQHATYCKTLEELGIDVIRLPRDDVHPDSCFVEDNAVVFGRKALICRMAKESRRGEEVGVEAVLSKYLKVWRAFSPATIEGGDVIHLEHKLVSGITQRTNLAGTHQMSEWLKVKVETVVDKSIVHLKSYVNYLGEGKMISTQRYAGHPSISGYEVLTVRDDDWYSTNNIVVGDTVIMPKGFPRTQSLIKKAGFEVIALEMTEFPKCEGALTCLSILF